MEKFAKVAAELLLCMTTTNLMIAQTRSSKALKAMQLELLPDPEPRPVEYKSMECPSVSLVQSFPLSFLMSLESCHACNYSSRGFGPLSQPRL